MSTIAITILVVLGFAVMLTRRRSVATALVAAQALVLGIAAISVTGDRPAGFLIAAIILAVRAAALPLLLVFTRRRTPEPYLVVPATTVLVRLVLAAVVVLIATASIPPLGLVDHAAEHGAVALLVLGIAIVATRRPALLQVLGILVAENGVYLLAISVPGGLPFVIELGVLFDLVLVVTVATAFTQKIHAEVGSGDTDLLRGLRD